MQEAEEAEDPADEGVEEEEEVLCCQSWQIRMQRSAQGRPK